MRTDVFDRTAVLARFGDDHELLAEVIEYFIEDCPRRLRDIKNAVDAGDPEQLRRAAHELKGAAGNLSAATLLEAAERLERIGAEAQLDEAGAAWTRLSSAAADLIDALGPERTPKLP